MKKVIKKVYGKFRNDRWGVIVELEDGKGNKFEYMPTYQDIEELSKMLLEVEELNKKFCYSCNG